LNSDSDSTLDSLKGTVVGLYAFQMLCPSCAENSVPQAKNVHALFEKRQKRYKKNLDLNQYRHNESLVKIFITRDLPMTQSFEEIET